MRPMIRLLAGVSGLASVLVGCGQIAGLGPPLRPNTDAGALDAAAPLDAGTSDAGGSIWLDPTFGDGGSVGVAGSYVGPHGLLVQPNGDILYCGASNDPTTHIYELLIGRLKADGSPDSTFGAAGQTRTGVGQGLDGFCNAVALLPTGSLVAAGLTYALYGPNATNEMFAARFTIAGQVDTTFGDDAGFAFVDTPDAAVSASALLLRSDDSIVLGGVMVASPAIALISAAGVVDPSFGANPDAGLGGIDVLPVGGDVAIEQLAPRANGGYVAATRSPAFLTLGITPGGALDPTYGADGLATVTLGEPLVARAGDMVVQPNGATVCVGSTVDTLDLVRFDAEGHVDPAFGTSGLASTPTPMSLTAAALALLPDGSFAVAVATATSLAGATNLAGVVRFTAEGVLDKTFGQGGFAMFPVPANVDSMAIAADPAGHLYVAIGVASSVTIVRLRS
jgi:uncharacterized delta-60 repeat protein